MDFKSSVRDTLFKEYQCHRGIPDENTQKKLNALTELIVKKAPFKELEKLSYDLFDSPPLVLMGFDADRIKDYVFASSRPKEIRGASAIIEEFTDKELNEWLKEFVDENHTIFAGGGAGLVIAPAHLADKIKEKIEIEFRRLTITATCTVEYEKFFPFEFVYGKGSGKISFNPSEEKIMSYLDQKYLESLSNQKPILFGKLGELLGAKIRRTKNSKLREEFYPLSGIFRRCASCGIRPASQVDKNDPRYRVDQPWRTAICDSCAKKRDIGKAGARSFEEFGRFISVVYMDVNKMGLARESLKTPEDYHAFSETIEQTFKEAIANVAQRLAQERYQKLVMGGDDLILILPAEGTLDMINDLVKFIEDKFTNPPNEMPDTVKEKLKKLTLAVGFVIAPCHFPIKFLVSYAFKVMEEAKKISYRYERSAINFLVLKDSSPLNVSIEDYIKTNYKAQTNFHKTLRPYTVNNFREGVLKFLPKFKGIPNAQLNLIKDLVLDEMPRVALLNIRYQMARMRARWQKVFEGTEFENIFTKWANLFIRLENGTYKTGYIDLLELLEFWR